MSQNDAVSASSSNETTNPDELIGVLRNEIAEFTAEKERLEAEAKRLILEEDIPAGKIYAKEIHELRQDKMRVEVEILAREQRIRRITFG